MRQKFVYRLSFIVYSFFFALLLWTMPATNRGGSANLSGGDYGLWTDLFAQESFTYDAKGKRDPFVPLVTREGVIVAEKKAVERVDEMSLEGIVWDKNGKSFAMISGEIVVIGDIIWGFRVLKIEQDSVTVESGGIEYKIIRKE